MKISLLAALSAIIVLVSCQAPPSEERVFTESPEIDLGKKVVDAYLSKNWGAYSEFYSDTVKIWRNKSFDTDPGMTLAQYIESLQQGLEYTTEYKLDPQIWYMIVVNDGERWVLFYTIWVGNNQATGKSYEIPLHAAMRVENNKILTHIEFYNEAEVAIDMQALVAEEDEDEDNHDEEEDDKN
jgi:hypothetical protein